jgi:hypothetical protein
MLSKEELQLIRELLYMLKIKSKTDAMYNSVMQGLKIIDREINNDQS